MKTPAPFRLLNAIQNLSIEVVAASVCSLAFAAEILEAEVQGWWYIAFPFAVWVLYTTDHLIDARVLNKIALNPRHRFHQLHFCKLVASVCLVGIGVLVMVFSQASLPLMLAGIGLFLLSLVHMLMVNFTSRGRSQWVQKELMVALIYTGGSWMGPLVWTNDVPSVAVITVMVSFLLTVWGEGMLVAAFELQMDAADGQASIATRLGMSKLRPWLLVYFFAQLLLLVLFLLVVTEISVPAVLILGLMNGTLLGLLIFPKPFVRNGMYHLIGELIFFLPALLLLF
ncbi:MAG: hypothetical protein KKD74_02120 [Bacteroidetes bacterium]|nr:hypothetical protein [Bacteroidota bacterium]